MRSDLVSYALRFISECQGVGSKGDYLDLMQGTNILPFVTSKISEADSKFLICFSSSKMSALNYAERILLLANLFQFPTQNHHRTLPGASYSGSSQDSSVIGGTHMYTWVHTHTHARALPPFFGENSGKCVGEVLCGVFLFQKLQWALVTDSEKRPSLALGQCPILWMQVRPAWRRRGNLCMMWFKRCWKFCLSKNSPHTRLLSSGTLSIKTLV